MIFKLKDFKYIIMIVSKFLVKFIYYKIKINDFFKTVNQEELFIRKNVDLFTYFEEKQHEK